MTDVLDPPTDLDLVRVLVADDTGTLAEALAFLGLPSSAVPDDDPPGRFPAPAAESR